MGTPKLVSLPRAGRGLTPPTPFLAGRKELTQEVVLELEGEEGQEGGLQARAESQQLALTGRCMVWMVPSVPGV